jgi:hypothetical protein
MFRYKGFSIICLFLLLSDLSFGATKKDIAELYVATFNRASDADGLAYWDKSAEISTELEDIEDIAQAMLSSAEAHSIYAGLNRENTIIKMYENLFNRVVTKDDDGVIYWASGGGSTVPLNSMILALINGALNDDKEILNNKTLVGLAFAEAGLNNTDFAISIFDSVTIGSYPKLCIIPQLVTNKFPNAIAGQDEYITQGTTVTLDASSSYDHDGTIISYEWKEGNKVLSNEVIFSKSDFSVGTHTITLTVVDDENLISMDTINIHVSSDISNYNIIKKYFIGTSQELVCEPIVILDSPL